SFGFSFQFPDVVRLSVSFRSSSSNRRSLLASSSRVTTVRKTPELAIEPPISMDFVSQPVLMHNLTPCASGSTDATLRMSVTMPVNISPASNIHYKDHHQTAPGAQA